MSWSQGMAALHRPNCAQLGRSLATGSYSRTLWLAGKAQTTAEGNYYMLKWGLQGHDWLKYHPLR